MEDGLDDWQGGCSVCGECPSRHGTGRAARIHNALQANVLSLCGFLRLLLYLEGSFSCELFLKLSYAPHCKALVVVIWRNLDKSGVSNIDNNIYHRIALNLSIFFLGI